MRITRIALLLITLTVCKTMLADDHIAGDGIHTYTINADEITATITGYTGPVDEVTIPARLDGYLVTGIDEAAYFNKGLTGRLTIPAGVRSIALDAFNGNHGLTEVAIPASVSTIADDAFANCDGVTAVWLNHVHPDVDTPPTFDALSWSDADADDFAGPDLTAIHVTEGTLATHCAAVKRWLEVNGNSVVDDIARALTTRVEVHTIGFGTHYCSSAWVVPAGVQAAAITFNDIDRGDATWRVDIERCAHRYQAGDVVPGGAAVLVQGAPGIYNATIDYDDRSATPFGNLLHGRDFPCVTDYPDYGDDAVAYYRLTWTDETDNQFGFMWETCAKHDADARFNATDGGPLTVAAGEAWLALTLDEVPSIAGAPWLITPLKIDDTTTAVSDLHHDDNTVCRYYNLQGIEIAEPAGGLYIERRATGARLVAK